MKIISGLSLSIQNNFLLRKSQQNYNGRKINMMIEAIKLDDDDDETVDLDCTTTLPPG